MAAATAAFLFFGGTGAGQSQESQAGEYQVKAAFLFHFAQFVEWPAEAFQTLNDPLTYCTIGEDPFRGALDESVNGKNIAGRALRVLHLKGLEPVESCRVLFVGIAEKKRQREALANAGGHPVLTVGDADHFVQDGGIIGFCREQNKIRFEINLDAAGRANLKISAKLLALAKAVIANPRGD